MSPRFIATRRQPVSLRRSARSSLCRGAQVRRGVTATEAVISAVLLGVTVAAVGKFANLTHEGLRERALSAQVDWELANAREQIGSWAPARVTEVNVESIAFSKALQQHFDDLAWDAEVQEIETPIAALQVRLSLTAKRKSQAIRPAELTFWVPREIAAVSRPADELEDSPTSRESSQTGTDSEPSEDDDQSASGSGGGGS